MKRYAIVHNAYSLREAEAYLPDNYRVVAEIPKGTSAHGYGHIIKGEDVAGWTLDGYVIPRYASGLIVCTEIDLSHPIMKEVSAAV